MKFVKAEEVDIDQIVQVVQKTIVEIYPKYYPKEVTDFFLKHHNRDNIEADVKKGNVWMLLKDDRLVGTGSYEGNHINRVYVRPDFQGSGYGGLIMDYMEDKIKISFSSIVLDASLPACQFYEKKGFNTIDHKKILLEKGKILIYDRMKKDLVKDAKEYR